MSKMSTDLVRVALNGPTMGTRWSVVAYLPSAQPTAPLQAALQAAVDRVDQQMSTWKPDSDLMRLNAAPLNHWVEMPPEIMTVLQSALSMGHASSGAFEIAMGDAVNAWGFGAAASDPDAVRNALKQPRRPSYETLELDPAGGRVRKLVPMSLDLSGIAKGFGTDQLAQTLKDQGISQALAGIDGELRALGDQPGDKPWSVAVERPDLNQRSTHSVLALRDISVATSGDYRHWLRVGDHLLSHTMDPARGAPLLHGPASVTVLAPNCMLADALATAFMVMPRPAANALARQMGVCALALCRSADGLRAETIGDFPAA